MNEAIIPPDNQISKLRTSSVCQSSASKRSNGLVGIVSYNINSEHLNYGAALHSIAFQHYLKKELGLDSVIIDYVPRTLERYNIAFPFLNNINIFRPHEFLTHQLLWFPGITGNWRKLSKFKKFFKTHSVKTKRKYTFAQIKNSNSIEDFPFDTFIAESDVIWKLYNAMGFDDIFFLDFPAAKGKRKIAYAPSLGSRSFSESEVARIRQLTSDFHSISTREKQGAEYLSKILNRDVEWLVDPTLLMDSDFYSEMAANPKEKNYLLVYNCMLNDTEMIRQAQRLAADMNLELIEISNFKINQYRFRHKVKVGAGIEEFLGYFRNASFVICNAFHGCCFANIFHKEFFLFERDNSDFRMRNITDALGESDRLIPFDNKRIPTNPIPIEWDSVETILSQLRQKANNFLQTSLNT